MTAVISYIVTVIVMTVIMLSVPIGEIDRYLIWIALVIFCLTYFVLRQTREENK